MHIKRLIVVLGLAIFGLSNQSFLPLVHAQAASKAPRSRQTFPKIEAAFQIPGFNGDPFDFETNDVRAELRLPNGKLLSLAAFYDGDGIWRVRHTPAAAGVYQVTKLTLNSKEFGGAAKPARWNVGGVSRPGFIRIDPKNSRRFAFDSGARYYPLGANAAWTSTGMSDYPLLFSRFKSSGQNWSRVWMNHWDGKNFDWPRSGELGQINLEVARRWDSVVERAAQNGIYIQVVLQHHGQYSSTVNTNWPDNPYNIKNGGFLNSPEEFFTNPQAIALTKRKLRYAIARYGYCPQIMAWELWNEVQYVDAAQNKHWDVIAKWHREMADFIRSQDVYGHLITSSSELPDGVLEPLDYYQIHAYPSNLIRDLPRPRFVGSTKPYFIGETGSDNTGDRPDEWTMHSGLWAGLFGDGAGGADYWYTDKTDAHNWYFHFAAATGFLKASNFVALDGREAILPARVDVVTTTRGPLTLSPNGGWEQATRSDFDFTRPADVEAFAKLPQFIQGRYHREMSPAPLKLTFNAPLAGTMEIRLATIAKAGADLKVTALGKTLDFPFPATAEDSNGPVTLSIPISAGLQTVVIENVGLDWVAMRDIAIPNAAMTVGGLAKTGPGFAMAWFYNVKNIETASPVGTDSGTATIAGVTPGEYKVTWWDTLTGQPVKIQSLKAGAKGLQLSLPAISRDVAVWASKKP